MQNSASVPTFPNSAELRLPVVSRRRSNFFRMGLICLTLASANLAMGQMDPMGMGLPGDPFFLTLGRTTIPAGATVTFYYELKIQQTSGGPYNFSAFNNVTNASGSVATYNDNDLAKNIAANLNADPVISTEYTCNVERTVFGYMEVICLVNPGKKPQVIQDTVDVRNAPDMVMSAGTWQGNADITFEIDGTPSNSPTDAVFIGLDGYVIEVPSLGNLTAIRAALLAQLAADGFNASLDPTGQITVKQASDGNPPPQPTGTGDWGGLILSTDPGLIVTAQMKNVNGKANEPEAQGLILTPGFADNFAFPGGNPITISVSGFPPTLPVTITVDGQPAGTIPTDLTGSGSGTILLPANTTGVTGAPYEIQGTSLTTQGFHWITLM